MRIKRFFSDFKKRGFFTILKSYSYTKEGEMDRVDKRIKLKTSKPKLGRAEALKPGAHGRSRTLLHRKEVLNMMLWYFYPNLCLPLTLTANLGP